MTKMISIKGFFSREPTVLALSFFVSTILLFFAGYTSWSQNKIKAELSPPGFENTYIIKSIHSRGAVSGREANDYVANPPRLTDGVEAILSRESTNTLLSLPIVKAIFVITKSNWQLYLPDGNNVEVSVFNVPKEFISAYSLGDSSLLRAGYYVPTFDLDKAINQHNRDSSATLSVPTAIVNDMPPQMRKMIDWSKARINIDLANGNFKNLGESTSFAKALFTTGDEQKIAIPGLFLIPTISVFVKLRDDTNVLSARKDLERFVSTATPRNRQADLTLTPFSSLFEKKIAPSYFETLAKKIDVILLAITQLMLLGTIFLKYSQSAREIVLRRLLGAPVFRAYMSGTLAIVKSFSMGVFIAISIYVMVIEMFVGYVSRNLLNHVISLSAFWAIAVLLFSIANLSLAYGSVSNRMKALYGH